MKSITYVHKEDRVCHSHSIYVFSLHDSSFLNTRSFWQDGMCTLQHPSIETLCIAITDNISTALFDFDKK